MLIQILIIYLVILAWSLVGIVVLLWLIDYLPLPKHCIDFVWMIYAWPVLFIIAYIHTRKNGKSHTTASFVRSTRS